MDWRRLAMDLALMEGKVTERGAALVEHAMRTAGVVNQDDAEFLIRLKRKCTVSAPAALDRLVYEVLRQIVLLDGRIEDKEARWLRSIIFADRVVTRFELQFLEDLRSAAQAVSPEFESLYRDCKFSPEFSRT